MAEKEKIGACSKCVYVAVDLAKEPCAACFKSAVHPAWKPMEEKAVSDETVRGCETCWWRYAPSDKEPCAVCDGYEFDKWKRHEWTEEEIDRQVPIDYGLAAPELTEFDRENIRVLQKMLGEDDEKESGMKGKKDCSTCFWKGRPGILEPCKSCDGYDKWDAGEPIEGAEEEAADTDVPEGIADSGQRRAFSSGAVRDMAEGKGRCDLLPLEVIASILKNVSDHTADFYRAFHQETHFCALVNPYEPDSAKRWAREDYITRVESAAVCFVVMEWPDEETAVLDLARHFERGALKYEERNWEKGIPAHSFLDSAVRHMLKHFRGDRDEDHRAACLWNLVCLDWTLRAKPEFDDLTAG